MWHAGRFVPPTPSALQLWQDVFGRWKVGEGTRGLGGCRGLDPWWDLKSSRGAWSEWDPHEDGHLWGCMSPSAPGTFNFVESLKKKKKKDPTWKRRLLWAFRRLFPFSDIEHWSFSANWASVLTNQRDECCAAVCRINIRKKNPTVWSWKMTSIVCLLCKWNYT